MDAEPVLGNDDRYPSAVTGSSGGEPEPEPEENSGTAVDSGIAAEDAGAMAPMNSRPTVELSVPVASGTDDAAGRSPRTTLPSPSASAEPRLDLEKPSKPPPGGPAANKAGGADNPQVGAFGPPSAVGTEGSTISDADANADVDTDAETARRRRKEEEDDDQSIDTIIASIEVLATGGGGGGSAADASDGASNDGSSRSLDAGGLLPGSGPVPPSPRGGGGGSSRSLLGTDGSCSRSLPEEMRRLGLEEAEGGLGNSSSRTLDTDLNSSSRTLDTLHATAPSDNALTPSEADAVRAFGVVPPHYPLRGAACKNRALFDNLDRTIEAAVVAAAPPRGNDAAAAADVEGASRLLRRRVKMCFAAMTVVFATGGGAPPAEEDCAPPALDAYADAEQHRHGGEFGGPAGSASSAASASARSDDASCYSGADSVATSGAHAPRHSSSGRPGPSRSAESAAGHVHRPPVPLAVARMMWEKLLRNRGGLGCDGDDGDDGDDDDGGGDESGARDRGHHRHPPSVDDQVRSLLDDVKRALVHTLALVDAVTNFDADDETDDSRARGESRSGSGSGRRRRSSATAGSCGGGGGWSAADDNDDDDERRQQREGTCLRINHDIHLLYGQSIALTRPDIFFDGEASYGRYLYRNTTRMSSWEPEVELNDDMAEACLECINRRSSAGAGGGRRSSLRTRGGQEYDYSVEMVPWHMLRSGRYQDVADILGKRSFFRQRVRTLGILEGTRVHVSDVEELNARVAESAAASDLDMPEVIIRSHEVVSEVLQAVERSTQNTDGTHKTDGRALRSIVEIAESLQCVGTSLLSQGFDDDAMDYYSRALDHFELANSVLAARSPEDAAAADIAGSAVPSIDRVQFLMADTLVGMASVYDSRGRLDDSVIHYERALSFYSRQRSIRHRDGVAKTLTTMGILHFRRREWEEASACFDEALVILQSLEINDNRGDEIGDVLQWMGNIRREMGEHERALSVFTEAFYVTTLKYGKNHPSVGRIHQSIAIIHDDWGDFDKSLSHYGQALKIRKKAAMASRAAISKDMQLPQVATVEELALAETLKCMGNVHRVMGNYDKAYECYSENAMIMRLDLSGLLGSAAFTLNGLLDLLEHDEENNASAAIDNLYKHLMMALDMVRRVELEVGDVTARCVEDKSKFDTEDQVAGILYDVGIISGTRYLQRLNETDPFKNHNILLKDREEATECFEEAIGRRRQRIKMLTTTFEDESDGDNCEDEEKLIIAFALYELGKLFAHTVLSRNRDEEARVAPDAKEVVHAESTRTLQYYRESRQILKALAKTLPKPAATVQANHDPVLARVNLLNSALEEMTQTMAIMYREMDQPDKAVECYNEILMLHSNVKSGGDSGEDSSHGSSNQSSSKQDQHEKVASSIQSIGDVLRDQGEFKRAMESYSEALELRRAVEGDDSLSIAATLRAMGRLHLQMEEWSMAINRFDEELRILVDLLDEHDPEIAYCFHQIGKAYEGSKEYPQALEYFKRARRTMQDNPSNTDVNATHIFFDMGNILLQMDKNACTFAAAQLEEDDFDMALECLTLAYNRYRSHSGDDALETANASFLKGELFYGREEYNTAISCFEESLRVYRKVLGEEHIKVARTLNLIGLSHLEYGDDDERAMECFDACLAILRQQDYDGTEDHACVLFYKGAAHEKKEELDLAIVCYEGSVAYYNELLGKDHIKCAVIQEKLGSCLLNDREAAEAKAHLEEALRIRKLNRADNDIETAEILYGMGIIHCENREYNKSLDCYEEAMRIRQEQLGEKHIEVAQVLNNVGSVFARNGEYERAMQPWQDAIDMYRDAGLSDDHPKVACTLSNIAISKNLVSVAQRKGEDSAIRTFLIY